MIDLTGDDEAPALRSRRGDDDSSCVASAAFYFVVVALLLINAAVWLPVYRGYSASAAAERGRRVWPAQASQSKVPINARAWPWSAPAPAAPPSPPRWWHLGNLVWRTPPAAVPANATAPGAAPGAATTMGVSDPWGGASPLEFTGGEVFIVNGGGARISLGKPGAATELDTWTMQAALWRLQLPRGAPTPRRFVYKLTPTGSRANCGCAWESYIGEAYQRCRSGTLVVTCGAPRASFSAKTDGCDTFVEYATTEPCPPPGNATDLATLLAPHTAPPPAKAASTVNDAKLGGTAGVITALVIGAASVVAALAWLGSRPATAAECPVCMTPITGAFAACAAGGHAVCAGCLQRQARVFARDLADAIVGGGAPGAAAPQQLPTHFMACPRCRSGGGISFARARDALQRAGNALGVAEVAHAEALRLEVDARRSVAAAIERVAAGNSGAANTAELVQRLRASLRAACCPSCGVDYGTPTDACMHAYCLRRGCPSGGRRFCGYCFDAGCAAETCPLNRERGNFMNPGEVVKQRAFAIARLRKAAQLLSTVPEGAAESALSHADVQVEVRAVLGDSFGGAVDLAAVRCGSWRMMPGSPLALHLTPSMRAHLAAAYTRNAAAGGAGRNAASERALDAAMEAETAAARAAEAAKRDVAAALRARQGELRAQMADLQAEVRELDEAT